jgi:biofilm PGA synthesis lipoprotein PgaB
LEILKMRWLAPLWLIVATFAAAAAMAAESSGSTSGSFISFSYHEARDDVRDYPDPYAVDAAALVQQFAWLKDNGYTPVTLDQIVAARQGGKPLPSKAVLLTFDDSYLSFYTHVWPLLREFRFPAVLGVVGRWIDKPQDTQGQYGEKGTVPDALFPTWAELREMVDSGLVEIASHTYDLHHGIPANPQGNLQPAATSRRYDAATGRYEDDASWRERVRADLTRNVQAIERNIGRRPRAIVWPYGSYNDELLGMASELGMPLALTLEEGPNTPSVPLTAIRRILVEHNPSIAEFTDEARGPRYPEPIRVVQVNLDSLYAADPAQQERNLSALLDRIQILKPSHVYLQAYADPDGDGVADALYFPNRHLPVRADIFNRVAWQVMTRNDVKVFAWLPLTAFRAPQGHPLASRDPRASSADPEVRKFIIEIYEDLARHASFDGLLFYDDPRLAALSGAASPRDADLTDLTQQITTRVRAFRGSLQTARGLSPDPVVDSAGDARFTQSLSTFAKTYDQVWLRATPPTERNAAGADEWLTSLADRVVRQPEATRKVVFELETRNVKGEDEASGRTLARQLRTLQRRGVLNFGYYSDDYASPSLPQIVPVMSLRIYPQ